MVSAVATATPIAAAIFPFRGLRRRWSCPNDEVVSAAAVRRKTGSRWPWSHPARTDGRLRALSSRPVTFSCGLMMLPTRMVAAEPLWLQPQVLLSGSDIRV